MRHFSFAKALATIAGLAASTTAMAQTWDEAGNGGGDAGDLPSTAQWCLGAGPLSSITGNNDTNDVDMFGIEVIASAFSATTVGVTTFDTQLFLFDATGRAVVMNDDDPGGTTLQSRIGNANVTSNGQYFLAIARYNLDPQNAANELIWLNGPPFNLERTPDGPGAGDPFPRSWTGTTTAGNAYTISLTGADHVALGTAGACCRPDGACVIATSVGCANQSGIYRGDGTDCSSANCPQPATGACCLPSGCQVRTAAQCAAQGGVYQGDNTGCATTNCPITEYVESGDAGELPDTAAVCGGSGQLLRIRGELTTEDCDMYRINICTPGGFNATTVGGATYDTQLFLFNADGIGVTFDDDTTVAQSTLTSQFVASLPAGTFYIAVTSYNRDPQDAGNQLLWINTPFNVERAPDGPGAANPVRAWTGGGSTGPYSISLQGACWVSSGPAPCYANCDGSTTPPILNVNDFICFQGKYAAGDPAANCDESTAPPILNVNDFICFQGKYAAGCP